MLIVLNTQTRNEVTRLRAGGEYDDVFFDTSRMRIYVIGGEGLISVFQQNDHDHYELIANIPSGIGIRTRYFYTRRDRFYVGVPARGNEPAQVWTYEAEHSQSFENCLRSGPEATRYVRWFAGG